MYQRSNGEGSEFFMLLKSSTLVLFLFSVLKYQQITKILLKLELYVRKLTRKRLWSTLQIAFISSVQGYIIVKNNIKLKILS